MEMAQGEQKPLTPMSAIAEMTADERDKWLIDYTVEFDPKDPFKNFTKDEREKIKRVMDGINGKRL